MLARKLSPYTRLCLGLIGNAPCKQMSAKTWGGQWQKQNKARNTKLSDASAFALSPTTPLSPCAFFKPPETSLLRLRAASSLINTDFLNATHPDQVPSPCEQQRTTVCIAQTLSQPSHLQSCASRAT
jgi:hypothetical protein